MARAYCFRRARRAGRSASSPVSTQFSSASQKTASHIIRSSSAPKRSEKSRSSFRSNRRYTAPMMLFQ